MKIRSFGCSFIFGTDLPDTKEKSLPIHASQLTWPALIAKKLGLEYKCHARGGAGNLLILDRLLTESFINPGDFFIVNWTWIDRFDYSDINGIHHGQGPNDWSTIRPTSQDTVSKNYYKNLNSEYRDKLTSLIYIDTAVRSLQKQGNRFLMTYMDDILLCNQWNKSPGIESLQESIYPHLHDFDGKTFLNWSRDRNYPISDTLHPLEQAHDAAAEFMLPRVQDLLNNKNNRS